MKNKNSHKQINVQHVYYIKFIITKKCYYYKKLITKNKGKRKQSERNLQKARKKSKCERREPKRNLQQARKKVRAKEKP